MGLLHGGTCLCHRGVEFVVPGGAEHLARPPAPGDGVGQTVEVMGEQGAQSVQRPFRGPHAHGGEQQRAAREAEGEPQHDLGEVVGQLGRMTAADQGERDERGGRQMQSVVAEELVVGQDDGDEDHECETGHAWFDVEGRGDGDRHAEQASGGVPGRRGDRAHHRRLDDEQRRDGTHVGVWRMQQDHARLPGQPRRHGGARGIRAPCSAERDRWGRHPCAAHAFPVSFPCARCSGPAPAAPEQQPSRIIGQIGHIANEERIKSVLPPPGTMVLPPPGTTVFARPAPPCCHRLELSCLHVRTTAAGSASAGPR